MCKAAYLHVPFCDEICAYCDFVRCRYHQGLADKWLTAIIKEIHDTLQNASLQTLYIGGGTPSALRYSQLECLLQALYPYRNNVLEYTMEANVESFDRDKMKLCKEYGVNRISLGVQSLQPAILKTIHRHHQVDDIKRCIDDLHEIGITNISIDLIYGLPGQCMAMWKQDLYKIVHQFSIDHISLYALTIEEHSDFGRAKVTPCDSDIEADMYEYALAYLEEHGFRRYEISNFARTNKASLHNQMYWRYEDFYGIGMGASGKQGMMRYDNTRNMETYFQKGNSPLQIVLRKEDAMFEMLMMSMRMKQGLSLSHFKEVFHEDLIQRYQDILTPFLEKGQLIIEGDYLHASDAGMLLLNDILIAFLP